MSEVTPASNPLAHVGVRAQRPPEVIQEKRAPTALDAVNLTPGDHWIDTNNSKTYILASKPTGGTPTWIDTSAAAGVTTITGDTGSATGASIQIAGGTNLTSSATGAVVTMNLDNPLSSGIITRGAGAGAENLFTVEHTDNTNVASHATAHIKNGGTSGGDPRLRFEVNGTQDYMMGVDNSDGDKFKLVDGTDLSTGTQRLTIDATANSETHSINKIIHDGIDGSFAGSEKIEQQAGVQTTDATLTVLDSYTLATNSAVSIQWNVVMAKSDHSSGGFGTVTAGARRVGAGAVLISPAIINWTEDDAGAPVPSVTVNGNDLRLNVTGVAATTFNWVSNANIQPVLTNA